MKYSKTKSVVIVALMGLYAMASVQAQFLKKIKTGVEDNIITNGSDKTDGVLYGEEITTVPRKEEATGPTGSASNNKTCQRYVPGGNTKKECAINDNNTITYKAPSKDFIDVVIQSHRGLPRYGELHFLRGTTAPTNNRGYEALLELKFLKETIRGMDRTKLTGYNHRSTDLAEKNSQFAQQHLLELARDVVSDELLQKYFCDPEAKTPCNFYNPVGERTVVPYWGGTANNEFAQNRSYKAFVKNYYKTLRDWSETFYKDGSEIVYYVGRAWVAEKYDFKNKGYWLGNMFSRVGSRFMRPVFLAYSENEKVLKSNLKKVFLPVEPNRAKELNLLYQSPVFAVLKVKVIPSVKNPTHVAWEFELESTTIEFYRDVALTQKMGEVDSKTMKLKP